MRYQARDIDADDFGPEDFESDRDAELRRIADVELKDTAERLRRRLARYVRDWQVQVSDDARTAATCRHCMALLTGDRARPGRLEREIFTHRCDKVRVTLYGRGIEAALRNEDIK